MESDILATNVREVVVVTEVDGEEAGDSSVEVSEEVGSVSPFDSGTEIAAVEEVANGGDARQLERMLKVVRDAVHKSRRGRPKRHWNVSGGKVSTKTWKRFASENGQEEEEEISDIEDYLEMGGKVRMKPKKRLFAHRLQWSNMNMESAMRDVQEHNMTLRGAAKKHNVPYSTLKDRIQGRVVHGTKPGVKTVLSPEEEKDLVVCIQQLEAGGFHLHCNNIRELARQMLTMRASRGCNMPYRDGCPGHNWLAGFLKRHPGIQMKRSPYRNVVVSASKQKQILKRFYDVISRMYKKAQLYHRPDNIFCVGEIKIPSCPRASVIIASNATGSPLTPFIVLRGSTTNTDRPALTSQPEFTDAVFYSSKGKHEEDILLTWFRDHFLRRRQIQRGTSSVLLIGRPVSDLSLRFIQLADEENVMLASISNGIAHLVQPLNANVLRTINAAVSETIEQFIAANKMSADQVPSRSVIASILSEVWSNDWPLVDIEQAFSESGIYPLNVRAITMERIVESMPENADVKELESGEEDDEDDDEDDIDDGSDDAAHGLNLLSELSTMEQVQDSTQTHSALLGPSTSIQPERLVAKRVKRETEEIDEPREVKVSEELMRRILSRKSEREQPPQPDNVGGSPLRTATHTTLRQLESQSVARRPNVRAEIVAARHNLDQIDRAVSSIVDTSQQQRATKLTNSPARQIGIIRHRSDRTPPTAVTSHDRKRLRSYHEQHQQQQHQQQQQQQECFSGNVSIQEEVVDSCMDVTTDVILEVDEITERKDVIEEVDLSDLYVQVENTNQPQPQLSNVIVTDLQQLAMQVQPDQKVDIVQHVMIGGRTVQIIRRVPFEQVLRSNCFSIVESPTVDAGVSVEDVTVADDIADGGETTDSGDNNGDGDGDNDAGAADGGETYVIELAGDCELGDDYIEVPPPPADAAVSDS